MVSKVKQCWTFEVLGPSMIYNRFNREISCHCVTASPCHQTSQSIWLALYHLITASLHHRITVLVSHLPCSLPPNKSVIWLALYHHITVSLHHQVTKSPRHRVSQSFALPPATKPVSHFPCPLPPNQSVIWLALYHCVTASPHHCATASPRHRITASPHHCLRFSPPHGYESDWLMLTSTVVIG